MSTQFRLITWNCNMAFRKKAAAIMKYKPDIVIVPECEQPDKLDFRNTIPEPRDIQWIGDNKNKGLAVISFSDYKLKLHPDYNDEFKLVLPVQVIGRQSFNLLAIWAKMDKIDVPKSFIGTVWLAVNYYKNMFKSPSIIAGDFNWNCIWDNPDMCQPGSFDDTIVFFDYYKIDSCYHYFFNEEYGGEQQPTLYFLKQEDKPFHIDYCFVTENFLKNIKSCEVGLRKDWIGLSDHMPMILDFDI